MISQGAIEMRRRRRRAIRLQIEKSVYAAGHEVTRGGAALTGAGLVGYGAWLAWPPAGFVVVGLILIAGVWLHDRNEGGTTE
jgi:hypothetical protein